MRGITSARLGAPIGRIAISALLAFMLTFYTTPSAWALTNAATEGELQTMADESSDASSNDGAGKDSISGETSEGQGTEDSTDNQEAAADEELPHESSVSEEEAANAANALTETTATQTENTETIQGSTKSNDVASEKTISASVKLIGIDSSGKAQTWANNRTIKITQGEGEASVTAADATEAFFKQAGITATIDYSWGWFLQSVTSPFNGMTYEWNTLGDGAYWQLYVDGSYSMVGASEVALAEDGSTELAWYYKSDSATVTPDPDEIASTINATVSVVGPNAEGALVNWAYGKYSLPENTTVAGATTRLFTSYGLQSDAQNAEDAFYLSSITSPFSNEALTFNTLGDGAYWRLFVNGEEYENQVDEETFASPTIHNGDVISWQYLPAESEGVDPSTITSTPNAERPDYSADWSGFGNGGTQAPVTAQTPVTDGKAEWTIAVKDPTDWQSGLSDPVIAGEFLYQVAGSKIQKIETKTGTIAAEATLAKSIDYTARTVYAEGLVIVPLSGGQLQALTADSLTPVWLSEAIPEGEYLQCLSSLTVSDGSIFFAASNAGWSTTSGGFKVSVSLKDGSINWIEENGEKGYYWSGFSLVNGYLITVGDQGIVECLDPETGKAASSGLAIACGARSSITVAEDGKTAFFSDVQGTLHRITVEEDGSVRQTGRISFAPASTSTPVLANGKVFVGGDTADYKGVLAVIDAETMTVEHSITSAAGTALPGPVKSTPLVSVQGSAVYAYFACNTEPGGIYVYKLGDSEASALFTPEGSQANYCMASPICDSEGNLYYTNDSGTLFKISGKPGSNEGGNEGTDGNDAPIVPGEDGGESGANAGEASGSSGETGLNLVRAALGYIAANQKPISASSEASAQTSSEDGAVLSSAASASGEPDTGEEAGGEESNGMGAWAPVAGMGVGAAALLGVGVFVLSHLGAGAAGGAGASGAAGATAASSNANRTRRN